MSGHHDDHRETPVFRLINLTPHTVSIIGESAAAPIDLPSEGTPALVAEQTISRWPVRVGDTRVVVTRLRRSSQVSGLPPERRGVLYVVPRLTAAASRRTDLVFPHGEIRDDRGVITGVSGLGEFGGNRFIRTCFDNLANLRRTASGKLLHRGEGRVT